MSRVIVVGLDGGTWALIKPWADEGELPTFKRLMANGVWGTLESTIPPLTGPAWASFSTGKNPGKHGVFGFTKLENNVARLYTPRDVRGQTLPEILARTNLRSVLIGLPLSFPPAGNFRGIMLSDFLYPDIGIRPRWKRKYIRNYRPVPNTSLRGDALLSDILETAESQVETSKKLFAQEKWDFGSVRF